MAQKITVQFFDDLDGTLLTGKTSTVSFALEGTSYELDLSSENRAKLRAALAPFIKAARKTSGPRAAAKTDAAPRRSSSRTRSSDAGDAARIREWAKANGHVVSERGRISAELRAAYAAAQ